MQEAEHNEGAPADPEEDEEAVGEGEEADERQLPPADSPESSPRPREAVRTPPTTRQAARDKQLVPPMSRKGKGKGKGKSQAASPDPTQQERSESLRSIAQSMEAVVSTQKDADELWAELLGMKVKKIPEAVRDHFKLHVDTLALHAKEGKWP